MTRIITLISLGLGLALMGFRGFWYREPPGFSRYKMDPIEKARTSAYLDGQFRARAVFVEYQDRIYKSLARGELTLITGAFFNFPGSITQGICATLPSETRRHTIPPFWKWCNGWIRPRPPSHFKDWPGYAVSK